MSKLLFKPVGLIAGIVAGLVGRRLFERAWRAVDSRRPPKPEESAAELGRLAAALAFEGALFRLMRGLAQHGSRRAFARATGVWPGERARAREAA